MRTKENTNQKDHDTFRAAIRGKRIPILVLDQKWHRLFAIHGKTDEIKELEGKINGLLALQGKKNTELKELKKKKNSLMDSVVQNMDETLDNKEARMEKTRQQIEETKQKMEECEDILMEIPKELQAYNEDLMVTSMGYFYEKLQINTSEAKEIEEWINQMRVELKKNIIRKQNREINNREIYGYLHDVVGPEGMDLFDVDENHTDMKM